MKVPHPDAYASCKHYSYEKIKELAEPHKGNADWKYATITLGEQDTAVNPASTKHLIYGPCIVKYEIHKSGITAVIS
jgi:hypothetical protein